MCMYMFMYAYVRGLRLNLHVHISGLLSSVKWTVPQFWKHTDFQCAKCLEMCANVSDTDGEINICHIWESRVVKTQCCRIRWRFFGWMNKESVSVSCFIYRVAKSTLYVRNIIMPCMYKGTRLVKTHTPNFSIHSIRAPPPPLPPP